MPFRGQQIERRERRGGYQARMEAGGAEGRFILRHDVGSHHRRQDFHFPAGYALLLGIADHRGVHLERHALLQTKAHQSLLLVGIGGERVEIEHRHPRAVIRQDDGGAPFAISIGGRECLNVIEQNLRLLNVIVHRRNQQNSGFEARKFRQRGLRYGRERQAVFGQLEDVGGRRILKEIGERHRNDLNLR